MYNEKGAEAALDNLVKSLREAKEQKASADEDITYADLLFFRKGQAKSFRIGLMLNLVQQWCGINAILGYSTNIFKKQANASGILAMGLTLVIGVVNLIWAMMLVPVIGKYGRKPLL